MNPQSPAIVLPCYNRPKSLLRLLKSIDAAYYNTKVDLVFCIDYSGNDDVCELATKFEWVHGQKRIIKHEENIGLKKNILFCGALSEEYGAVIVLEDDLFVAPGFYDYTQQALDRYEDDQRIAGISLYKYLYNEFTGMPFYVLQDGFDNHFIQTASSSGQAWTWSQWQQFKDWFRGKDDQSLGSLRMPRQIKLWPQSSWKKFYNGYLADENKYFVYPNVSLSTNMGESGVHFSKNVQKFQSNCLVRDKQFTLSSMDESLSKYDSFFEIDPNSLKKLNPKLCKYEFVVDMYGNKEVQDDSEGMYISICDMSDPIMGFGCGMIPQELNVAWGVPGDFFKLGNKKRNADKSLGERKKLAEQFLNQTKQDWFSIKDYWVAKCILWPIRKSYYCLQKFIKILRS